MRAWRICQRQFADISGDGARLFGGRWNEPNWPMVYMAEHPALAMLELLVHLDLDPHVLPQNYVLMTLAIPDELSTEGIDHEAPPSNTAEFGTKWIKSQRTPILWVPSVLMPQSYNILLNPTHPSAHAVRIEAIEDLKFDPRLL